MPTTAKLLDEIRLRLRTTQPILWIESDEPSRTASVVRNAVLEFVEAAEKKRLEKKRTAPSECGIARQLFEHDVATGLHVITENGEIIRNDRGNDTVIGRPVDFLNKNDPAKLPTYHVNPNAPWRFIVDVLENVPSGSIVLCHNFAEVVDMALRCNVPHAGAMMRNALLLLTGTLGLASSHKSFKDTSRMLIATGRLPHAEIARSEISETFDILRFDRPSDEELAELIRGLCDHPSLPKATRDEATKRNAEAYNTADPEEHVKRAARNIRGLTAFAAETATVRTFSATKHLSPALLAAQRKTLIERCAGLTLIEPCKDFEWSRVKGVENIEKLARRALRPDLPAHIRANSMTMVGPPGTGKSMVSAALANYLGVPLIACNLSQVFGKFVGESQRSMANLLATLDAIGDCVVRIDEADKQLDGLISDGGQRGDSGVGSQVMQLLLTWEQDRIARGSRAIVIKTANRINNLKAETQRAGRNDVTFFIDFPHASHRREIAKLYLSDFGVTLEGSDVDRLVRETKMWSGVEIRELVKNIARFGSLDEARQFVRPVYRMNTEDVTKMREEAKQAGIPASALSVDNEDQEDLAAASAAATRPTNTSRLLDAAA